MRPKSTHSGNRPGEGAVGATSPGLSRKLFKNLSSEMAGFVQLMSLRRSVSHRDDADEQSKRKPEHDFACDKCRGAV
jgi:hypothetical protein